MADYSRDADDRWLDALFAAPPVADDGFSERIVRRIRRRQQVRRLCLVVATVIGGATAWQPAMAFTRFAVSLLQELPGDLFGTVAEAVPSTAMLVGGGVLFLVTAFAFRLLED
ncbi:MAG TPA: hypothetical protein VFY03_07580 [Woeseiaceae bacterium]|nr:hypothetical protein [Woeseiaceae bacterium]